ncbi:MAG: restriction system-associated AAA family ATPase [Dolichospermum sp. DEX189]|uniref:Restriction system-associated AAA family ATPase n=1 Tax=Aphanizomenon flos-aquae FACHB-1040 TaxID=2692887 RepID=A0ABR8C5Z0_APHFL|nr:restriction system-associated AAA family ATPase [Aphanizomenon flos-aquae]MBD2281209.1 restriction system-associated AAA family ATPase [Aphanizomenon flos-aquae FACHB-1040]MBO1070602.1 restriction system-associated AAA family ATPase [Dolichospermum sp. DEX189]
MKLLRVNIISANTCGGLLDGLNLQLRSPSSNYSAFEPLCFIGPNGAGKSQFLQVLAEIFQSVFHKCISEEEREESERNFDLQFELEYLIHPEDEPLPVRVRISRKASKRNHLTLVIERRDEDEYDWIDCVLKDPKTRALLPKKIVGYTSGDNETLSLPFFVSRSGYARDVAKRALDPATSDQPVLDTRLMLIDYETNLEVLVANLLMGEVLQRKALLQEAKIQDLHSFRCIVQLAHSVAPKAPSRRNSQSRRKGIQLTKELETYLDQLKRCATCYTYDNKTETYTFDYWINEEMKTAFRSFWDNTLHLYSSFHKLAMLNDLALSRKARVRVRKENKSGRFASRLPEPQDEDKVFRFESVVFTAQRTGKEVDYVSLSDGEHQLEQILGTFCMLSSPNVLFLLDEPESHFNPLWRVKFISRILDLPTKDGDRRNSSKATKQECLLTTHSPFVPSDMQKDKVFIFSKDEEGKIQVQHPNIQTFGTTFDTIIEECFEIRPPISEVARDEIKELMQSDDPEEIKVGMQHLGDSVEKAFLADRLRQLRNKDGV